MKSWIWPIQSVYISLAAIDGGDPPFFYSVFPKLTKTWETKSTANLQ